MNRSMRERRLGYSNLPQETERMLTPREVYEKFGVDPHTLKTWANRGRLRYIRTLGGHRRYFDGDVRAYLECDESPVCLTCEDAGWIDGKRCHHCRIGGRPR